MKSAKLVATTCLCATLFAGSAQAYRGGGPWNWPWGGPGGTYTGVGPIDAFMNGDLDFNMSFSGSGRSYGRGYGRGYGFGYPGYAYGYPGNGYGYHPYGHRPYAVAYAPAPASSAPPVEAEPVEPESDNDSVMNNADLCPDTPAGVEVDFTGCTMAQPIALQGVNFRLDSDELTPESGIILDRVVRTLTTNPQVRVESGGHTDAQGDADYNLDLSARRAARVREYLIDHGVDADNLTSQGYGQTRLLDTTTTPEAHARNRRVELTRLDTAGDRRTR